MTNRLAIEVGASCAAAETVTILPMGGVSGGLYTPLALMVPSVAFPPKIPRPPAGPTYQRTVVVVPPVSEAVKVTLLAAPDVAAVTQAGIVGEVEVLVQDGELMVTTGAGTMVTVEVAKTF